jgi:hypothetical protein
MQYIAFVLAIASSGMAFFLYRNLQELKAEIEDLKRRQTMKNGRSASDTVARLRQLIREEPKQAAPSRTEVFQYKPTLFKDDTPPAPEPGRSLWTPGPLRGPTAGFDEIKDEEAHTDPDTKGG